ncbi:MAG: hypothetical protein JWP38_1933 [Herbaspirillum sp.]|nr:hypothetical protein [Herbaspirillum sp.]
MPLPKPATSVTKPVKRAAAKPAAKVAKPAVKRTVKAAAAPAKKAAAINTVKTLPAAAAKPAPKMPEVKKSAAKAAKLTTADAPKVKKVKQVRDSFTMPEPEYAVIAQVKKTCLKAGFEIKKSDLLRIGVSLISGLDVSTLKVILATLTPLKAGRPKK